MLPVHYMSIGCSIPHCPQDPGWLLILPATIPAVKATLQGLTLAIKCSSAQVTVRASHNALSELVTRFYSTTREKISQNLPCTQKQQ